MHRILYFAHTSLHPRLVRQCRQSWYHALHWESRSNNCHLHSTYWLNMEHMLLVLILLTCLLEWCRLHLRLCRPCRLFLAWLILRRWLFRRCQLEHRLPLYGQQIWLPLRCRRRANIGDLWRLPIRLDGCRILVSHHQPTRIRYPTSRSNISLRMDHPRCHLIRLRSITRWVCDHWWHTLLPRRLSHHVQLV